MEVTPPEKVRRLVDVGVGVGGDGSDRATREGRVRMSHDFRVRSSPPVNFVYRVRVVHWWRI